MFNPRFNPRCRSRLAMAAWGCVALGALTAGPVRAQSAITGTASGPANEPLSGARIMVASLAISVQSNNEGIFTIPGVPPGTYDLRIVRIGYRPATAAGVVVREREKTSVAVRMEPAPVMLDEMVVSVSRTAETITDAPAAVTHFDPATVGSGLGSPVTRLLQRAPGIDLAQVGVMSSFLNGRGFNRAFNSRWLTVEDGRVAAFPETGLPIGEHTTIPKIDLAEIEVIAGPGSALYGANASGGVMSVTTKDPRRYPGLAVETTGGTRAYRDIQVRYAGSTGRWGYKIAGEHQAARDWSDTVHYAAVVPGGPTLPEAARDLGARATRAEGSVRYYLGDDAHLAFNAGASIRDGLGHSTSGRYLISGYQYQDGQIYLRSPRWFAQAYTAHSNSEDTYRLNILTQTQARFPGLSPDSALAIAAFPVDGRIEAVEVQHNERIGALVRSGLGVIDNSRVTWGVQARRDRVDSYGRLYSDAATGQPIHIGQRALYFQLETRPAAPLRLVGAARYDTHSRYSSRWSPKLGIVFDLAPGQVLRVTFNGAYLAPSIFQSDVYGINTAARIGNRGNRDGFDIRDGSGALVSTVSPLRPEANQTWEAGFKGVLGRRFYIDATAYRSRLHDFMTLVPVANPFAATPTFAFNHRTGQRVEDNSGSPLQLFTFINVGEAHLVGFDAAFRYYVSQHLSLSSTTTLSHVTSIKTLPTDPPEATAFNTSSHRGTFEMAWVDAPRQLEVSWRARYVVGYDFQSGTDWGRIPSFATWGISASWRMTAVNTTLLLQADNIASCVGGTSTPPAGGIIAASRATYTPGTSCGFGIRHHELLNMPAIGTMVFVGVRREWR